jgi:dTDP-4-amino-4,6-dideoxygalactose transaminase
MIIAEKKARRPDAFRRPAFLCGAARDGFAAILSSGLCEEILLPAYIGWSANEGSGIMDPVRASGLKFRFYRLGLGLDIDIADLEAKLADSRRPGVLFVHYFGFPSDGLLEAIAAAQRYDALIVEDEAHSMLTDLVGGGTGRAGEATLFSLHKLLPQDSGGAVVVNVGNGPRARKLADHLSDSLADGTAAWGGHDLWAIAQRRRENARVAGELLREVPGVALLRAGYSSEIVPQTLPLLLKDTDRDALYFALNEAGVGAVSLYHTMIPELRDGGFPEAEELSKRIINFPIHQDLDASAIQRAAAVFAELLPKMPCRKGT